MSEHRPPDLGTSLTLNNLRQSQVGRVLDALIEAGFAIEINLAEADEPAAQP